MNKMLKRKGFTLQNFSEKNLGGFTLIEMLVVIAVVGILSAAVLTALGPARNKAKDSRIISALNQARAVAEILYDGDYGALPTTGAVAAAEANFGKLATDITANQGGLYIVKASDTLSYSAYSALASGGFYCVDSAGNAKPVPTAPTASACP